MNKNTKRLLSWIFFLFWLATIFYFSAQPVEKSNNLSKGISEIIIEKAIEVVPEIELNPSTFNHYLRKNAHFILYLILGILTMNLLVSYNNKYNKSIVYALVLCVLYAISDEIHQLFVPGRGGQIRDVLIDSAGSITGILIYIVTNMVKNKES